MQAKTCKRGSKSVDKLTVQKSDRPGSTKSQTCSNRIIQLALPKLHIVSSVLKDHFKTLSNDHIQRLEKLMDQIKTTNVSISQLNFMENMKGFRDSDKMKIVEVLNEVRGKKSVQRNGDSWKAVRLLPVKSSSDSILIGLKKKPTFFSHPNKSERNPTDSSSNPGTYNGVVKKGMESLNFNYRETVYIKVEGLPRECEKMQVEKNTKSVQTEGAKSETRKAPHETCNPDIKVLYMQTRNPKKKTKLRQLHTLLEKSDFIRDNSAKQCVQTKSDKSNQTTQSKYEEDIKLAVEQVLKFQMMLAVIFKFVVNVCMWLSVHLQANFQSLLEQVSEANDTLHVSSKIFRCLSRLRENIARVREGNFVGRPFNREEMLEHRKKAKKRRKYCTKTYHFSNIASILH